MNNEELNKIIMKADNDLDTLKDRLHELYEEKQKLKQRIAELESKGDEIE